jgi:hypothetical protein
MFNNGALMITHFGRRTRVLAALFLTTCALVLAGGAVHANAVGLGYAKVTEVNDVYVRYGAGTAAFSRLQRGAHFNVQWISPGGYAWGYAYGDTMACGWVAVGALTNSNDSHNTPPDCGPHRNIPF